MSKFLQNLLRESRYPVRFLRVTSFTSECERAGFYHVKAHLLPISTPLIGSPAFSLHTPFHGPKVPSNRIYKRLPISSPTLLHSTFFPYPITFLPLFCTSNMNSQVIVVGGGLAGLSAAHTLLERGASVLLLDKNRLVHGSYSSKDHVLMISLQFLGRCVELTLKTYTAV
jgi:hypothetical protein